MNIKKPSQSVTIYAKDLNANDRFVVPGLNTVYVCDSRQTGAQGEGTRIDYHILGDCGVIGGFSMHKVSMATLYLLTD